MFSILRYTDDILLGRSPTVADLEVLARKRGVATIVSLDVEGEPGEGSLSPNREASWAHTYGMRHERVSIDRNPLRSVDVDRFLAVLQDADGPVYVHSTGGQRARALVTVRMALDEGLSGSAALESARARGFEVESDELRASVAREIDRRSLARAS